MILAVDTSCYTTSMVLVEKETGRILFELNKNLMVKPGERGLRQSEGFFQHVRQLSEAYDLLTKQYEPRKIKAVAVSSRPRPVEGSYMPVFHAGLFFALNIANTLQVPLFQTTHQEGHLMAALVTSGANTIPNRFYGLHLSGGTTEILDVTYVNQQFDIKLIGGTLDLNFGQLIDRIGVKMGLAFPCGKAMDALAQEAVHHEAFKVKTKTETTFNLSGLENKYLALIDTEDHAYLCRHLFNTITQILTKLIEPLDATIPVVLSGGVSSNAIVKTALRDYMSNRTLLFAEPQYARDNAYGIAEIARRHILRGDVDAD